MHRIDLSYTTSRSIATIALISLALAAGAQQFKFPSTGDVDVDIDGFATASDIQLVINTALGEPNYQTFDTDVNNDASVDAVDIQLVINDRLGFNVCGPKGLESFPSELKQLASYKLDFDERLVASGGQVSVSLTLEDLNVQAGGTFASTFAFTILYDETVISPSAFGVVDSTFNNMSDFNFFYAKTTSANECRPGQIEVVVAGVTVAEITHCDDQIINIGHDTQDCRSSFEVARLNFDVIGDPGEVSTIAITDISAADALGQLVTQTLVTSDTGSVTIDGILAPPATVNVSGFVTDAASDTPLGCAAILLQPQSGGADRIATTDEDGFYFFDAVPQDTYNVRVVAIGQAESAQDPIVVGTNAITRDFDLTADPTGPQVSGLVTDAETLDPLPGIRVDALINNVLTATTYTCATGAYEFRNLVQKGTTPVQLQFNGENYTPAEQTVNVDPDGEPAFVNQPMQKAALAPASLSGYVLDSNSGLPVPMARVTVTGPTQATQFTDDNGAYTFAALLEGPYNIRASKAGFGGQLVSRQLESSASELQTLVLSATTGGTGSYDLDGDASLGASDIQLCINAVLQLITLPAADVNGDNEVNAGDVQTIINAVLGIL